MNINIRHENESDYLKTETVTREAFWNLYIPGCNEHLIVHNLRQYKDFIPELSFVIELNEEIVGSIFYSHSKIIDIDGREIKTITFGPVSIKPEFQRKGLGRELITYSILKAKENGYGAIIIGGFPYHYKPYGFMGAKKYNIAMEDGNFYTGIMALPLIDGYLNDIKKGIVYFSEAMETSDEDLETYDKKFPDMIKETLQCQKLFEVAVSEIDETQY